MAVPQFCVYSVNFLLGKPLHIAKYRVSLREKEKMSVLLVFTSAVKTPTVNAKYFPIEGEVDEGM